MKTYVREGKNQDEILQAFKKELNIVDESSLKYDVITAGSKGLMGFFAKPAILKFYYETTEEKVSDYVFGLFEMLNVKYDNAEISSDKNYIYVAFTGVEDAGFVIGKDARFLDSVQHLCNRLMDSINQDKRKIEIDIDGYRKRREESIVRKVKFAIDKVLTRKKSFTLEPMQAKDRRIVHQYIEKDNRLRTLTTGNGERKRVAILPVKENNLNKDGRKNNVKNKPKNKKQ